MEAILKICDDRRFDFIEALLSLKDDAGHLVYRKLACFRRRIYKGIGACLRAPYANINLAESIISIALEFRDSDAIKNAINYSCQNPKISGMFLEKLIYMAKGWAFPPNAFSNACEYGHVEAVKVLLKINESFDLVDLSHRSWYNPLILACDNGHFEVVKILMETLKNAEEKKRISLESEDADGQTALDVAIKKGYEDIVKLLTKHNRAQAGLPDFRSIIRLALKFRGRP